MNGAIDPIYVLARRVLLDTIEALGDQRQALILVGAQAIYLRTGRADLAVAEFTTDGDFAIDPKNLRPTPKLAEALRKAGFTPSEEVGTWVTRRAIASTAVDMQIDLMVPELVGGPGTRGARLGVHGNRAARKARGLEAALVDREVMVISALEDRDGRHLEVAVAGPVALIVSKLHKIRDRADAPRRRDDKDALDVLRLLRAFPTDGLVARIVSLSEDETAGRATRDAITYLREFFSEPTKQGALMAARAAAPLEDSATITASCAALSSDILRKIP